MQIPFLSEKNGGGELYCGILLKEAQGTCFIFEKRESSIHLLKQREFQYMNGWDHIVDDVDNALSIIEQEVAGNAKLTHCIFFVFSHLIDIQTKEISKQYTGKIRDLATNLELKPLGYMEVIDAIHEELQQEKQTPLSSVVVELDDTQMTVFLFKAGHKIAVQRNTRTDNFAEDMDNALATIAETHILPTHIYLYDSTDLAEESSDLMLHAWKKNIFIQQPRVAVIPSSTVGAALKNLLEKQLCTLAPSVQQEGEKKEEKKEVLGFTIGREVTVQEDEREQERVMSSPAFTAPSFSLPKFTLPSMPLIIVGVTLLVIGLSLFGFLYFFHKATVTIAIPTEKKEAEVAIVASRDSDEVDVTKLDSVVSSFSASEKKDTTGKRDIGEKASGEVTLYNYDEKSKEITKGTKLQVDSIQFETDDGTTIPASQFGSDGITKNPGKSKVKIRALVLGTESNMDKNKRFSIPGTSSNVLFAINESAITGGTKKTVRTIAKADIDGIRSFVLDKAKKNAYEKEKQSESSYILINELTTTSVGSEKVSGEIGEEADKITYTAKGSVTVYRIPKKSIEESVKKKLEDEKPVEYETDAVKFIVKKQKKLESGDIQLTIEGSIVFKKTIPKDEVVKTIVGKGTGEGESLIETQFGTKGNTITISPDLPLIQDRLPFWSGNIRVEFVR